MEKTASFRFYGLYAKTSRVNPYSATGNLLSQRILLEIAKEEKDSKAISKEVLADEEYVIDALHHLMKAGIVNKTADKYASNILLVRNDEKQPIISLGKTLAEQEAEIICDEIPKFRGLYEETRLSKQGFTWSDVEHITLTGFVLDLGVNRALRNHKMVSSPPQNILHANGIPFLNGQYWFWGVEEGWGAKRGFGVDLIFLENGGFGWVWGSNIIRNKMNLEATDFEVMYEIGSKSESVKAKTDYIPSTKIKSRLLKLRYKELINQIDEPCLTFPFLVQEDINLVEMNIARTCDIIVQKTLIPHMETIQKHFQILRGNRKNLEYGEFFCMFNRIVMDHCLDILIDRQILSEFPKFAPPKWAFWGWTGKSAILKEDIFL